MPIEFIGSADSFRTLKKREDGGGRKFSVEMYENQHHLWAEFSAYAGQKMKFTVEPIIEELVIGRIERSGNEA